MPLRKTETGIIFFSPEQSGSWVDLLEGETSRERLLELAEFGAVYLNDVRTLGDALMTSEDHLRVHLEPHRFRRVYARDILKLENEDLLIVDKPAGIPCHPTLDNLEENLLSYLRRDLAIEILPSHRLDIETSGLMVFAKTSFGQIEFQKLLVAKKVQKKYLTKVALPGPSVGFYEHHMDKTPYAPKTVWESPRRDTQVCQLRVLRNTPFENYSELEIELITGRTHQIRAQLSFLGFAILNDPLYAENAHGEFYLRCSELNFRWHKDLISLSFS